MAELRMALPDDVHRKLKAKAALEGISLRELIIRLLSEATEEDE